MNVEKIGENKIKIYFSDNEVLNYFGTYENIEKLSEDSKNMISAMLINILNAYGLSSENKKVIIEIKANLNKGCEIAVLLINRISSRRKMPQKTLTFEFQDSESLTKGMLYLYSKKHFNRLKSSLYKMPLTYRLTITSKSDIDEFFGMNEFCSYQSDTPEAKEYTKEYGKLIILNNAISSYGNAFSKDS